MARVERWPESGRRGRGGGCPGRGRRDQGPGARGGTGPAIGRRGVPAPGTSHPSPPRSVTGVNPATSRRAVAALDSSGPGPRAGAGRGVRAPLQFLGSFL